MRKHEGKGIKWILLLLFFDEWSHDLYSITEMSRKEAILTAIDNGVRLYLVKYRKGKQQGNKKRIATKNMA
ncbi:MAG: hypothetical protein ACLRH0_05320 [Blautia wexlerae]